MKELKVEIQVDQVEPGKKYNGEVLFAVPTRESEFECERQYQDLFRFQYELTCDQDLGRLEELAETNLEAATSQLHIALKDTQGAHIAMPEQVAPLFQGLILPKAAFFYREGLNVAYRDSTTYDRDQLEPLLAAHFDRAA